MKKKIAMKWVTALRSGEYKQGRQHLARDNEYCCLGVLCELAAKENVCEVFGDIYHKGYDDKGSGSGDELTPKSVMKWAGLKTNDGRVDGEKSLTELNDTGFEPESPYSPSTPLTFEQIADIIENYYKEL